MTTAAATTVLCLLLAAALAIAGAAGASVQVLAWIFLAGFVALAAAFLATGKLPPSDYDDPLDRDAP